MKYYLLNTIQRFKQYSNLLDAESKLYNKNLVVFNENEEKQQFIFRPNKELLISQKGIVSKAKWELLDVGTILIEIGDLSYLFNVAFKDDVFLILQLDGNNDYFIMYNNKDLINKSIDSIEDIQKILKKRYNPTVTQQIERKSAIIEDHSTEEDYIIGNYDTKDNHINIGYIFMFFIPIGIMLTMLTLIIGYVLS